MRERILSAFDRDSELTRARRSATFERPVATGIYARYHFIQANASMNHPLGPTGQLVLQTLGGIAMLLGLVLLVLVQCIEPLRRYHRIFTPAMFYVLFILCMALMAIDLLFTTHHDAG